MIRPITPSDDVRGRVEAQFGATRSWQPVVGGYSGAGIWVVGSRAGSSFFVKAATTEPTAGFLRDEHAVYSGIGAACIPEMLGWDDAGEWPILILEDLSDAVWPPPWDRVQIEAVLDACAELASIEGPDWLPSWRDLRDDFMRWRIIAHDPHPFLSTGLADRGWLDAALPHLLSAEAAADVVGSSVVHADVRSDNLCFEPEAKFVDWNWTRRGNPEIDVVAWLPSLRVEGGPAPWDVRADADANLVAMLAGYFASYAALPPSPNVNPRVRTLQRDQAEVCLQWLEHLGLTPRR